MENKYLDFKEELKTKIKSDKKAVSVIGVLHKKGK